MAGGREGVRRRRRRGGIRGTGGEKGRGGREGGGEERGGAGGNEIERGKGGRGGGRGGGGEGRNGTPSPTVSEVTVVTVSAPQEARPEVWKKGRDGAKSATIAKKKTIRTYPQALRAEKKEGFPGGKLGRSRKALK